MILSLSNFQPDIIIDGSVGEGGGSILRLAVGMACVFHKSILIKNIRANRQQPGLRLQHLLGIQALRDITNGQINDLSVGSQIVAFKPGDEWNEHITVSIRTAGNIGMLAQTLYNGLYHSPPVSNGYVISVSGGATYGKFAPGIEFLNQVTFYLLKKLGYSIRIEVQKHGFYPKGGADATIKIYPKIALYSTLDLIERGQLTKVCLRVHVESRLKKSRVAERIQESFRRNLHSIGACDQALHDFQFTYHHSVSIGVGVDAWIEFANGVRLGAGTMIGERRLSSEEIGKRLASEIEDLLASSQTIDDFAADQILPFLFLQSGSSRFRVRHISSHLSTNMHIMSQFTNRSPTITKEADGFLITI